MTEHSTVVAEKGATSEPRYMNQPLGTCDLASRLCGSGMTAMDIMSEPYKVNGGVGNSFVFNLLFLSFNVFQKRKPPSKLVRGFFRTWLF